MASTDYFRTINVNLVLGRDFQDTDGAPGAEAVIVTRTFAQRFLPNENPIGRRVRFYREEEPGPWCQVIGVIADIEQSTHDMATLDPIAFVPYRQEAPGWEMVLVRASGSPRSLTAALRQNLQKLDNDLPLGRVMTLADAFARNRWHWRIFGTLFSIFAMLALSMAAVGMYAVMAHSAVRRTREIGVRLALGASLRSIVGLVLAKGLKQLVLGLALGLAVALSVTRLMQRIIFVSPRDPLTFTIVAVLLAGAGLLACWLPARRAASADPVKALRYE
jgi:hypothetical protein